MADHDALIEKLSKAAAPVKPVQPVTMRVTSWVLMALPAGVLASFVLERSLTDWSQPGAIWAIVQLALVFAIGLLSISNAFSSSIAGRRVLSLRWLLLLAAFWLMAVGMSLGKQPLPLSSLHDTRCYTFMVTVSAPMMALALAYLRRTRTLTPARTLTMTGIGIACMALTLLAFCHPVHLHPEDFLMHIAAMITIVGATVALGWRWVKAW